jgi:hypothetical protein
MNRSACFLIVVGLSSGAASAETDAVPAAAPERANAQAKAVCHQQVAPLYPRSALQRGESGIVTARVRVANGSVAEILSLEGPETFYPAVAFALARYKCQAEPAFAMQEFKFVLPKTEPKATVKPEEPPR